MNYKKRCYICGSSEHIHKLPFDYVCGIHFKDYLEFSKCKSKNTSTKTAAELQQIKQKYKNGIPAGEIERWILGTK